MITFFVILLLIITIKCSSSQDNNNRFIISSPIQKLNLSWQNLTKNINFTTQQYYYRYMVESNISTMSDSSQSKTSNYSLCLLPYQKFSDSNNLGYIGWV
jgi:hypothetical protein